MLKFVIIFLLQYLLSLLQYTRCLLIPVFTYEFTVFDITILTEILQYQLVKKGKKKGKKEKKDTPRQHVSATSARQVLRDYIAQSTVPDTALGLFIVTTSLFDSTVFHLLVCIIILINHYLIGLFVYTVVVAAL